MIDTKHTYEWAKQKGFDCYLQEKALVIREMFGDWSLTHDGVFSLNTGKIEIVKESDFRNFMLYVKSSHFLMKKVNIFLINLQREEIISNPKIEKGFSTNLIQEKVSNFTN